MHQLPPRILSYEARRPTPRRRASFTELGCSLGVVSILICILYPACHHGPDPQDYLFPGLFTAFQWINLPGEGLGILLFPAMLLYWSIPGLLIDRVLRAARPGAQDSKSASPHP
jgi:hypothetical protein